MGFPRDRSLGQGLGRRPKLVILFHDIPCRHILRDCDTTGDELLKEGRFQHAVCAVGAEKIELGAKMRRNVFFDGLPRTIDDLFLQGVCFFKDGSERFH